MPVGGAIMAAAHTSLVAIRGVSMAPVRPDVSELPNLELPDAIDRLTVVGAAVIESTATLEILQRRVARGDNVRVSPNVAFNAVVVDEESVILQLPAPERADGQLALVLRDAPLSRGSPRWCG